MTAFTTYLLSTCCGPRLSPYRYGDHASGAAEEMRTFIGFVEAKFRLLRLALVSVIHEQG